MLGKQIKKRSIIIALGLMLMFCLISDTAFAMGAETKHFTEWMLEIPDDTLISSITIPGTHNSGACHIFPGYFVQCQDDDIPTQLVNGFRFFDFHLALSTDKNGNARLHFANGIWDARKTGNIFSGKLYFDDMVEKIYSFLEAHPSETVILCIRKERAEDSLDKFTEALYKKVAEKPERWYTKNKIPKIADVRGKIILARGFEERTGKSESGLNFYWAPQESSDVSPLPYEASSINMKSTLWVQDRHRYNLENKINAYRDTLSDAQAGDDDMVLNFLSTDSTGYFSRPAHYAKYINEDLLGYKLSANTSYGVIIVDFATKDIAKHIFNSNFKELEAVQEK